MLLSNGSDEAKTSARQGSDKPLLLAAVAERRPNGIYSSAQSGLRNNAALPDRRQEIVLADDAFAVLDQVKEQVEYLGLNRNLLRPAKQLTASGI